MPLVEVASFIDHFRDAVRQIVSGADDRVLVVVSPCSVHDPAAAMEYARWLAGPTREYQVDLLEFQVDLLMVTRAHAGKARTATSWTGVVNGRCPDGNCEMAAGLRATRAPLLDLAAKGVPTPRVRVDPRSTSYLATLVIWRAIGARTAGSQVHRHLASTSSPPMPVDVKNAPDSDIRAVTLELLVSAVQSRRSRAWLPASRSNWPTCSSAQTRYPSSAA
jgi:3-deoxy-7-phosphoheptulonate synthase